MLNAPRNDNDNDERQSMRLRPGELSGESPIWREGCMARVAGTMRPRHCRRLGDRRGDYCNFEIFCVFVHWSAFSLVTWNIERRCNYGGSVVCFICRVGCGVGQSIIFWPLHATN